MDKLMKIIGDLFKPIFIILDKHLSVARSGTELYELFYGPVNTLLLKHRIGNISEEDLRAGIIDILEGKHANIIQDTEIKKISDILYRYIKNEIPFFSIDNLLDHQRRALQTIINNNIWIYNYRRQLMSIVLINIPPFIIIMTIYVLLNMSVIQHLFVIQHWISSQILSWLSTWLIIPLGVLSFFEFFVVFMIALNAGEHGIYANIMIYTEIKKDGTWVSVDEWYPSNEENISFFSHQYQLKKPYLEAKYQVPDLAFLMGMSLTHYIRQTKKKYKGRLKMGTRLDVIKPDPFPPDATERVKRDRFTDFYYKPIVGSQTLEKLINWATKNRNVKLPKTFEIKSKCLEIDLGDYFEQFAPTYAQKFPELFDDIKKLEQLMKDHNVRADGVRIVYWFTI